MAGYKPNNNKVFDPFTDYSGQIFCHLKALHPVHVSDDGKKLMYEFECLKCGKHITEWMESVFRYNVRSCGCTKYSDIVGGKFSRLTVVEKTDIIKRYPPRTAFVFYRCKCDCGKELLCSSHSLVSRHAKSCGCLRIDQASRPLPEWIDRETYAVLSHRLENVKQRCYNPKNRGYPLYGAKGVTVCDEWMNDTLEFCKWFVSQPNWNLDMEIDRINAGEYSKNSDGPYAPWNCRLAYRPTQLTNRSSSHFFDIDGHHLTGTQWAKILHLAHRQSIYSYFQHHGKEETIKFIREKMKELGVDKLSDREILYRIYGEKALDGGQL